MSIARVAFQKKNPLHRQITTGSAVAFESCCYSSPSHPLPYTHTRAHTHTPAHTFLQTCIQEASRPHPPTTKTARTMATGNQSCRQARPLTMRLHFGDRPAMHGADPTSQQATSLCRRKISTLPIYLIYLPVYLLHLNGEDGNA